MTFLDRVEFEPLGFSGSSLESFGLGLAAPEHWRAFEIVPAAFYFVLVRNSTPLFVRASMVMFVPLLKVT